MDLDVGMWYLSRSFGQNPNSWKFLAARGLARGVSPGPRKEPGLRALHKPELPLQALALLQDRGLLPTSQPHPAPDSQVEEMAQADGQGPQAREEVPSLGPHAWRCLKGTAPGLGSVCSCF